MTTGATRVIARGTDDYGNVHTLTEYIAQSGTHHYRVINGNDAMSGEYEGVITAIAIENDRGRVLYWEVYMQASWTDRHVGNAYNDAERGELVADAFESLSQTRFTSLTTY